MFPTLIGNRKNKERGIFVAEILIVAAIIAIALISFLGIAVFSLKASKIAKEESEAISLAEEAIEAARSFRDGRDWDTNGLGALNTNVDYYPSLSGAPPTWDLVLGAEVINRFTRKIVLNKVSRDPVTNDIEAVYNSANDDPNTREVNVNLSWEEKEIQITSYLTNWEQ